jgi:glycosyltransferase involved in cell wall biosynthesis
MKDQKISVITSVYNEEKNISKFLDSILTQSQKPDEIVIVDGGSKDKTMEILKAYSKKNRSIKVYVLEKSKISEARNLGVEKSKGDLIFTADCGTLFEKDWIKKLLHGFKDADVVFGKYLPKPKNIIEKFLISRLPDWKHIKPNTFIPSNRQCAFRRIVWTKVGGWPNHIRRADDNWFHERAHALGFKYKFIEDAIVYWIYERNLKSLIKLSFLDSKSEGFSHLFIKRKIYFLEFFVLVAAIFLILLGLLINTKIIIYSLVLGFLGDIYLGGVIPYRKTENWNVFFAGIVLTPIIYFAHIFGVVTGIIQRSYKYQE